MSRDENCMRQIPSSGWLLALAACMAGCQHADGVEKDTDNILQVVDAERTLPAMLIDDLAKDAEGLPYIRETFQASNSSAQDMLVMLKAQSCGCVGVFWDGKRVNIGQGVPLAPGASGSLTLEIRGAFAEGLKSESVILEGRRTFAGRTLVSQALLSFKQPLFERLNLRPGIIRVNVRKDDDPQRMEANVNVRFVHEPSTTEGGALRVEATELPAGVSLSNVAEVSNSESFSTHCVGTWAASFLVDSATFLGEKPKAEANFQLRIVDAKGHVLKAKPIPILVTRRFGYDYPKSLTFATDSSSRDMERIVRVQALDGNAFVCTAAVDPQGRFTVAHDDQPRAVHFVKVVCSPDVGGISESLLRLDCKTMADATGEVLEVPLTCVGATH